MSKDADTEPEIVRISIIECFADLPDPRVDRNKEHKLIDILVIAICAVIAGCEACTQMAEYGRRKESWLRRFLELPNGIPWHDTFSRVLALIDPGKFQECFMRCSGPQAEPKLVVRRSHRALRAAEGGRFCRPSMHQPRNARESARARRASHDLCGPCSGNAPQPGTVAGLAKRGHGREPAHRRWTRRVLHPLLHQQPGSRRQATAPCGTFSLGYREFVALGPWTSPSAKTRAAPAKDTAPRTWPHCDDWQLPCSNVNRPNKALVAPSAMQQHRHPKWQGVREAVRR